MAEAERKVVVRLKGNPWEVRAAFTRSVAVCAPDATKLAEWLEKTLPELIAVAKSGYGRVVEVSVED